MYYLPLLPGYGPGVNVRSSAPAPVAQGVSYLSEAEENGYQGLYFTQPTERTEEEMRDGYISSDSPVFNREVRPSGNTPMVAIPVAEQTHSPASLTDGGGGGEVQSNHSLLSDSEIWTDTAVRTPTRRTRTTTEETFPPTPKIYSEHENVEVIFFEYGVVVFFGLTEAQEKDILEDIDNAGIMKRKINYDHWEVEECHFTVCEAQLLYNFQLHLILTFSMIRIYHILESTMTFSVRLFPSALKTSQLEKTHYSDQQL